MKRSYLVVVALLALACPDVLAQQEAVRSPYVGWEERALKALSEDDVRGLLEGEGLGYALAAELNGWPGPRHVIDMDAALELSADQRESVEAIHDRMKARARDLGARLVGAEKDLDARFASGEATVEDVEFKVAEIARLEGSLRSTHLVAHIETRRVLTDAQVALYVEARGYAGAEQRHEDGHVHPR